jgi:hypothetical protein
MFARFSQTGVPQLRFKTRSIDFVRRFARSCVRDYLRASQLNVRSSRQARERMIVVIVMLAFDRCLSRSYLVTPVKVMQKLRTHFVRRGSRTYSRSLASIWLFSVGSLDSARD